MAKRSWATIGMTVLFGLGVATGIFAAAAEKRGLAVDPAVIASGAGVLAVLALGASLLWWRGIDEAQREAHKAAWFWGGSAGMLAALAALVVAKSFPGLLPGLNPDGDPHDYVMIGLAGTVFAQYLGYGLAWAGWWWRTRA